MTYCWSNHEQWNSKQIYLFIYDRESTKSLITSWIVHFSKNMNEKHRSKWLSTKNRILFTSFNMKQKHTFWIKLFRKKKKWKSKHTFIEKIMNNYHFIVLNFVVLITYMQTKTQKMCECQNTNFNKNALVFFSSNYINWILIATFAKHICENCISTFFYNNRLCFLFCILTNSVWFEIFVQTFSTMRVLKFFQRINFFNDITFSAMRCLKFSNKFTQRDMT